MSLRTARNKIKRLIFIVLGIMFLVLGIIGYVVPGLPGTIWLIVAASFFVRSSNRLYGFVVHNRFFGHQVGDFLETGQMPRKAKIMALLFIWVFSIASLFFAPYGWFFKTPVVLLAISGSLFVLTRPTSGSSV